MQNSKPENVIFKSTTKQGYLREIAVYKNKKFKHKTNLIESCEKTNSLLLERIQGKTLRELLLDSQITYSDLKRVYGSMSAFTCSLSKGHIYNSCAITTFKDHMRRVVTQNGRLGDSKSHKDILSSTLSLFEKTYNAMNKIVARLTHHDLSPQNIMVSKRNVFIIDFEYSDIGCWPIDYAFLSYNINKFATSDTIRSWNKDLAFEAVMSIDTTAADLFKYIESLFISSAKSNNVKKR